MKLIERKKIELSSLFSGMGRKFIFYFLSLSVVPVMLLSVLGYKLSQDIVIQQNRRYLELQNELVSNRLSGLITRAENSLSFAHPDNLAFYKWLRERLDSPYPLNREEIQNVKFFLNEKIRDQGLFNHLALISREGRLICSSDTFLNKIEPVFWSNMINNPRRIVELPVNKPKYGPLLFLRSPLKAEENTSAYITGSLSQGGIFDLIANYTGKRQVTNMYICNANNEILFFSGKTKSDSLQQGSRSGRVWQKRANFIYSQLRLEHPPWVLISEINRETALAEIIQFGRHAAIGVGLLLLILFSLAVYMTTTFVVPIRQLVYAAQDIGDGLLYAPIRIRSSDEVGLLARELDEMRKKLLDYYENLEQMVQDRTEELKKAQFQIMQQEKMASLGLMAAGIAHEIGNPLTSISSLAQLLKRRLKDETNQNYLATIMKNIDRISRIVRDLVDFSRPSNFQAAMTDVNEVAQAALGIVKYDGRSKRIEFHLELDRQIPSTYLVADQLLQVFINILFNAVDAMENHGTDLTLRTYHDASYIYIDITDTGCGIAPEQLNKIFEPFYTTKDVGKGTGLGLSVSYGIIKNFNGDIKVKSEPGKGTTFTIKLPIRTQNGEE
ncbi:MAG: hypothetical protein Kow0037_12890 [Calditrichia bacterium]